MFFFSILTLIFIDNISHQVFVMWNRMECKYRVMFSEFV